MSDLAASGIGELGKVLMQTGGRHHGPPDGDPARPNPSQPDDSRVAIARFYQITQHGAIALGFTFIVLRHGSAPKYAVPETVADVQRGVRYIKQHAADFGVDANRLGVYGASAGGHLTLMIATTGDDGKPDAKDDVEKGSSRVACVVSIFPPTDLRGWTTDPPEEIKKHAGLKPPLTFSADLEDDVSPLLLVTEKTPPVLLIHGDKDTLVPIEHSLNIVPVLEKANVENKLLTIEGAGHGFNPEQQKEVTAAMVDWFLSHLAK